MNQTLIAKALVTVAAFGLAVAPLAANAGEVHNRIERQQARINQGVRSGELTAREYRSLDRGLDHIQAQRLRDLKANGGKLTPAEYAQLNREENRLSDRIWFDKHNAAEQAGSP